MAQRTRPTLPRLADAAKALGLGSALTLLVVAAPISCGGSDASRAPTEPEAGVSVVLSSSVSTPSVTGSVSCTVDINAAVTGTGLGTWTGAIYRMFDMSANPRLVASGELTGASLLEAFGTGSLIAGRPLHSSWLFTGAAAFSADVEMQYQPAKGAVIKSATTRFDCVPSLSRGTAAPTIGTLSVTPSRGTLEAGTPITVHYAASLPAGALKTSVRITGPCVIEQTFDEYADTTLSRTLEIPLRYPCRLGIPIAVDVIAFDVLGRGVARYEETPVTMLDTVPPRVDLVLLHVIPGRTTAPEFSEYALGDTLVAHMLMNDNYRVSALLWELVPVGVKDSIVSQESPLYEGGTSDGKQIWIGIRPEWAGRSLQLRLQARDATGRLSEVLTTPLDSIRVAPALLSP